MKRFTLVLVALVFLVVAYGVRQEFRAIATVKADRPAGVADDTPDAPPTPLRVLVREGYFSPGVRDEMESALGVNLEAVSYASDEECRRHLDAGEVFDLMLVPDHLALRLDRQNRTFDIAYDRIPNHRSMVRSVPLERAMSSLVRCAVPLFYTTIGLGYDTNFIGSIPLSWDALFRPADPALLRGNIGLLNDARRCLGVALISLGYSPNSVDPAEIRQAAARVRDCMALYANMERTGAARQGGTDLVADLMNRRQVFLGMATAASIARAMETNPSLRFASPTEGSIVCFDVLVIPRDTRDRAKAEDCINFLLDPRLAARLTNESGYATTNEGATAYFSPSLYHGPAFALPSGRQFNYLQDLGDAEALYEDAWRELAAFHRTRIAPALDREVGFDSTFIESNDKPKP